MPQPFCTPGSVAGNPTAMAYRAFGIIAAGRICRFEIVAGETGYQSVHFRTKKDSVSRRAGQITGRKHWLSYKPTSKGALDLL